MGRWVDAFGWVGDGVGFPPWAGEPYTSYVTQNVSGVQGFEFGGVAGENEELTGGLTVGDETVLVLAVDDGSEVEDPV